MKYQFAKINNPQFMNILNSKIIYYSEKKYKKNLLFIHGINSSSSIVSNLWNLKRDYNIIIIDLPGFGDSSSYKNKITVEYYIKIIEKFIDKLKLKNIWLIGYSFGAIIVAALAKNKNIKKGILISPLNPFASDYTAISNKFKKKIFPAKYENNTDKLFKEKDKITFKWKDVFLSFLLFWKIIFFIKKRFYYLFFKQIFAKKYIKKNMLNYYIESHHKLIGIHGENDKIITKKSIFDLEQKFKIKFYYIKNCGHNPFIKHSKNINLLLHKFIKLN